MDPTALHLVFLAAVGIPALSANVTNSIALLGSGLGSTLGSRPELREHGARPCGVGRPWRERWSGAVLLLATPPGVFAWVVPFLVASAAVLLLLQPRIARWHTAHDRPIAGAHDRRGADPHRPRAGTGERPQERAAVHRRSAAGGAVRPGRAGGLGGRSSARTRRARRGSSGRT